VISVDWGNKEGKRDDSSLAPDHPLRGRDGISKEGQKGFESESKDGGPESPTVYMDLALPPAAYCTVCWK
jgi:hypothetical protein